MLKLYSSYSPNCPGSYSYGYKIYRPPGMQGNGLVAGKRETTVAYGYTCSPASDGSGFHHNGVLC